MLIRKQGNPLYKQIADLLEQEIHQFYKTEDSLPPEQELADRFSVNRHTLRKGIDQLVTKGLVERVHGRGVFVLGGPLDYSIGKGSRFTANLVALGKGSDCRLLRNVEIKAQGNIAKSLELELGAPVIWLETLRSVEEKPLCVISHYLPKERLGKNAIKYQGGSLHAYLKGLGIKPIRKMSTVTAVLPMDDDAVLLVMSSHQPILRVKTLNRDEVTGLPIEYALARFRADRTQLSINID
ncbi:MAG: phosphonate metabolism transcriptional regulator PhnF [Methyloprofundus sp.]|nr:phosphonate metabolism transcriptional regulator PhnF [Methyloprofundus sp.]